MKSFCAFLVALTSLALVNRAIAGPVGNLSIVLEGPFNVCENLKDHTLKINIPNLGSTHYVPGFTAGWEQLPLGMGKNFDQYPNTVDADGTTKYPSLNFVMDSPWGSKKKWGKMDLRMPKNEDRSDLAYLYNEGGDCQKLQDDMVSVSFVVPEPDEVYPVEHAGETSWVKDEHGAPHGPCTKASCRHATLVVLVYRKVNFGSVPPRIHANVNSGNALHLAPRNRTMGSRCGDDDWCPDTSVLTAGNFEIKLDVQPITAQGDDLTMAHNHSTRAFQTAADLVKLTRTLTYYEGIEMAFPPRHNNCGAAMMFSCSSGTACKQSQ